MVYGAGRAADVRAAERLFRTRSVRHNRRMGVSLNFVTTAPVPETVRRAIESDAEGLQYDWWSEALGVGPDRHGVGFLLGRTKLFLIGYSTEGGGFREVDPDDDSLMAWRDATFTISQLARWSREHDLEWELRCEGEFVGRVKYGAADQAALDFLAAMIAGDPGPPESRPARTQQVAARYADRW